MTAVNETDGAVNLSFSRPASLWLSGTAVFDALFALVMAQLWLALSWAIISFGVIWQRERAM